MSQDTQELRACLQGTEGTEYIYVEWRIILHAPWSSGAAAKRQLRMT